MNHQMETKSIWQVLWNLRTYPWHKIWISQKHEIERSYEVNDLIYFLNIKEKWNDRVNVGSYQVYESNI
jgi:hypothetical protein